MVIIRKVSADEKQLINQIVSIHLKSFTGFFLTFMGRGFLNQMYRSYCEHDGSGLLVAEYKERPVGFLAYSGDFSGLYKYMIRSRLIKYAWYSIGAFFRKPTAFVHIIKAFLKPGEAKRSEKYVELSSIGVNPSVKSKGIGSKLIDELKKIVDFDVYNYITLETDAVNNEVAIHFYEKNGFAKERIYKTSEGRKMIEYRYWGEL